MPDTHSSNIDAFVFVGRAGSGKGTQVKLLREYLAQKFPDRNHLHFYAGDNFRKLAASEKTHTSELVNDILTNGGLNPSFLAVVFWGSKMVESMRDNSTIVLDGSPRMFAEAEAMDSAFKFYDMRHANIFVIDVPKEVCKGRLLERKRADDTDEAIENRLAWYDTEVVPMVDFFKKDPFYEVHIIKGDQSIEDVHAEIINAIS